MPYIPQERRDKFDPLLEPIICQVGNDGEVNYCITRLIDGLYSGGTYEAYERSIGLLECIKLEYYRRKVAEYENIKKELNGDVYK